MLPFKLVYSDGYYLPIGAHVFPAEKYRLVRDRLLESGAAAPADFLTPAAASDDDIRLVHTEAYVRKLKNGTLSAMEQQLLEVPYSAELVAAFWLSAGGSILAAQHAMKDGIAFNLGGGFHHAFPDHGEGFCMIHDVAVAIRRLQCDGSITRAMTVDCDVHHGNGTAAIFPPAGFAAGTLPSMAASTKESVEQSLAGAKPVPGQKGALDVFTISLHQANNYPFFKPPSCIDVNLPDHTSDSEYLAWLDNALSSAFRNFSPQMVCYIAGADPYREDQLGGLDLSIAGLKQRDLLVFGVAKARGVPVMVTYAGGYARYVEDTVTIHCNTVLAAIEIFGKAQ